MRAHPVFFLHQRGWIICACLCTCLCAVIPTIAQAQTGQQTRATMVPGLFAKYSDGSNVIQRIESNPKWDSESRASDPRFPSDAVLDVQWTGLLQIKEAGLYRMHVFASGKASLLLQEKKLLEIDASDQPSWHQAEIDLPVGQHPIQLDFRAEGNSEIGLFWSGGNFGLEPIPTRLLQHRTSENDVTRTHQLPSGSSFKTGSKLFRALRCAACHDAATGADGEEPDPTLRAPSLRKLQNNLRPSWLVRHLTEQAPEPGEKRLPRRMPYFALDKNSAMAISAALFAASEKSFMPLSPKIELEQRAKKRRKKDSPVRTVADVDLGGEVFASQGCLACHEADGLGIPSNLDQALFGGGDLSKLAVKRTASSVLSILQDPAMGNAQHRMPKFELDALQQLDLHAYLTSLGAEDSRNDTRAAGDVDRGVGLIAKHRCGACHELPDSLQSKVQSIAISDASNWISGCLQQANARGALPGYGLSEEHRDAIRNYVSERNHRAHPPHQLLAENNCLGCHARNEERGIVSHLIDVVEEFPGTASKLAALSPPSLNAVGDKLTDEALLSTIQGEQKPLRDWLEVQMPTFPIEVSDARSIANYLIAQDRVPANVHSLATKELSQSAELAASRLVTSQGFGCQSCHAVGPFETPKVDLKARGPNLSMLGNRVRESWFHRWVRNPSRIVPRMEMPAIQTPVTGLLNNDLDQQLDALWQTLNKPDFVPPRPNAERVVQNHNVPGSKEHANLVACVIESEAKNYLRPLAIGLPNRQNVLFDLEAGHWVAWWLGDTAAQYTRGKTWYWELGGPFLNSSGQSANSDAEPRPPVLQ
ncbi:MAG: c-type cytochrome, partial [Planctomycetota bacterium]